MINMGLFFCLKEITHLVFWFISVTVIPSRPKSGLGAGAVVGIVLGAVAVAITLSVIITMVIMKRFSTYSVATRKRSGKLFNCVSVNRGPLLDKK